MRRLQTTRQTPREAATRSPHSKAGAHRRAVTPTVLVGLDGREHDADALALAHRLGAALRAKLLLVHVIPPPPLGRGMVEYARQAREEGRDLLARRREEAGDSAETRLLETWPAAFAVNELAGDRRASLLVLGSSHRGPAGRIVPGGTASHLLVHAPCAVAVAPVGYAGSAAKVVTRIGLAYDATPEADVALAAAVDAARSLAVPLRLYHAMHAIPSTAAWEKYREFMHEFAHGILDKGLRQIPPGVTASASVLEGHTSEAIAAAALDDGMDLLFVGSRGYGPLREALVRGVSGGLLNCAGCPLVIVPARH